MITYPVLYHLILADGLSFNWKFGIMKSMKIGNTCTNQSNLRFQACQPLQVLHCQHVSVILQLSPEMFTYTNYLCWFHKWHCWDISCIPLVLMKSDTYKRNIIIWFDDKLSSPFTQGVKASANHISNLTLQLKNFLGTQTINTPAEVSMPYCFAFSRQNWQVPVNLW